jgi:hypothetical protein
MGDLCSKLGHLLVMVINSLDRSGLHSKNPGGALVLGIREEGTKTASSEGTSSECKNVAGQQYKWPYLDQAAVFSCYFLSFLFETTICTRSRQPDTV